MSFQIEKCYTSDKTEIEGLLEISSTIHEDSRGYLQEIYSKDFYETFVKSNVFVQDNISKSSRGVLRGLHFQKAHTQGKLIQIIQGAVYDVALDLRNESKTFGKYYGIILDDKKKNQLFIPKGFAHGFYVLSDSAISLYKCTDIYDPQSESGLLWNDPVIGIDWKTVISGDEIILSEKDKKYSQFDSKSLYFDMQGNWLGK